jgi:TetR/AcrR family transcriptional regulator, fatty acid metabolism regulator protein
MRKLRTGIRKEQYIRGALTVIARDGMKRLSVARVAREVGLVPSAVYRHFHSKDQLLDAVLDYIAERIQNNVRETWEQTEDPVERLHRFLMRQLKLIKENRAIPTVVFAQGIFSEDPSRREKSFKIFGTFRQLIRSTVQIGQKEGLIRQDVPSETIVHFWIGILQPAAFLYTISDGQYDLEKHGRRAWKLFLEMIEPM